MTIYYTNRGRLLIGNGTVYASTTLKYLACKGTAPTSSQIADVNFISDLVALSAEADASGYARSSTTTVTFTESDALDYVEMAFQLKALGSSVTAGQTWNCVALFNDTGGSDALRTVIWVDVLDTPYTTDGTDPLYNPATHALV